MKLISIVGRKLAAPRTLLEPYSDVVVHSFVDASYVARTQGSLLSLS